MYVCGRTTRGPVRTSYVLKCCNSVIIIMVVVIRNVCVSVVCERARLSCTVLASARVVDFLE